MDRGEGKGIDKGGRIGHRGKGKGIDKGEG
jgi:hypothetical protein